MIAKKIWAASAACCCFLWVTVGPVRASEGEALSTAFAQAQAKISATQMAMAMATGKAQASGASFAGAAFDPVGAVDMQYPGGLVFRGADVPWGMMMWGPSEFGFSLTALSGSEMDPGYSHDVPILPTTISEDMLKQGGHLALANNRHDSGELGHFRSTLENGISVELTATTRTGIGRFTFPPAVRPAFAFPFDHGPHAISANGNDGLWGWTQRDGRTVYFAIKFKHPYADFHDGKDMAYAVFNPSDGPEIDMKVALSFVRYQNAQLNMDTENSGWDFDLVAKNAAGLWHSALSKIQVEGGTQAQTTMFYTLLSHCLFHPNVFNDVNGEYMGFDGQVHKAVGYTQYANFSGWDIYRAWMPLIATLFPQEASDMMQSLVVDAEQGSSPEPSLLQWFKTKFNRFDGAMPRWPVDNIETGTMEAGSATPIVANAYAFGARDFDTGAALRAMENAENKPGAKNQDTEERWRLQQYLQKGYLAVDTKEYLGRQTAAMTQEYAIGDFSLSQYERALGHDGQSKGYLKRAQNWKNLFNTQSGYIQPKNADGTWWNGFDPVHGHMKGFTEGNSAQYSWLVPFNLHGLIQKMGGSSRAIKRLDDFFTQLNAGQDSPHAWMGNEPSFGIPWVYNWAGAPSKTQEVTSRILNNVFAKGEPGADDLGAMSAWGVWAALGLYPEIPGVGGLTVGSPMFSKVIITRSDGSILNIITRGAKTGATASAIYVQNLYVNGKAHPSTWIDLNEIKGNSTIEFDMGDKPSAWGTKPEAAPPSYDSDGN